MKIKMWTMKQIKIRGIILLILCTILVLLENGIVSAEPSFVFEQDEAVNLKVACVDEIEQPCNSTIHCNITILKPDHSILIDNQPMTYGAVYYTYNLALGQNSDLGEYPVDIFCLGIGNGFSTFTYEITETGEAAGEYRFAIYLIILVGWLLFIIGAYRTEYTFVALAGIILLISGVYVLINGLDNFNNTLTTAFGGIHALFGGYLMIRAGWEQYKDAF